MNIINKILKSPLGKDKVVMKPITWFKTDEHFAGMYQADDRKVRRICKNIEENGYDFSQPLIVTPEGKNIDGNSRFAAVLIYNKAHPESPIKELPCIIKEFDSKEEALKYEVHLNTDRRSITDADLFTSFSTLNDFKEKLKKDGKSTGDYSDKKLAEMLNISERQISKLRYVVNNASPEMSKAIMNNEITINNAESEIRKMLNPSDGEKKTAKTPKINAADFLLGFKFAISELKKGKSVKAILVNVCSNKSFSFTDEQLNEIESNIKSITV